jgi:hypothetical protein
LNLTVSAVRGLEQLAELYDEEFVASAYNAILGRPPDVGGLRNYLGQVRSGANKMHILVELALSSEGRSRTPRPTGLDEFIKMHPVRRRTFLSRLRRPQEAQLLGIERQLRAMDNHLHLVQRDLAKLFQEVAESSRFALPTLVAPSVSPPSPATDASSTSGELRVETRLIPKLEKTYRDLNQAISARR